MKTNKFYVGCGIVFAASVVLFALLRYSAATDFIRALAGLPAILALFGALFQLARDRIEYDRSVLMEQSENSFTVGATSHMAIVAFDKHVSFCEEYVVEVFATLETLLRRGPHQDALKHATNLYGIRQKWAMWLSSDVEKRLERFEAAVRKIGADAWLADQHIEMDDRHALIKKMYLEFAKVVGIDNWNGEAVPEDVGVKVVVEVLQKALGIDKLTYLRSELIERASKTLNESG